MSQRILKPQLSLTHHPQRRQGHASMILLPAGGLSLQTSLALVNADGWGMVRASHFSHMARLRSCSAMGCEIFCAIEPVPGSHSPDAPRFDVRDPGVVVTRGTGLAPAPSDLHAIHRIRAVDRLYRTARAIEEPIFRALTLEHLAGLGVWRMVQAVAPGALQPPGSWAPAVLARLWGLDLSGWDPTARSALECWAISGPRTAPLPPGSPAG